MGVAMVDVLQINTARARTFLHEQAEQFDRFDTLLTNGVVVFVLYIKTLKFVLVSEECIVEPRTIGWAKQGDVVVFYEALIHQTVELHAVVKMTYTVFFNTAVVLQNQ